MSINWHDPTKEKEVEWNSLVTLFAEKKVTNKEVTCPTCQEKRVHYFFARFPSKIFTIKNRGGGWIWCSHCRTYIHFSGTVPEWWIDVEKVPLEKLEHSPDWLDTNLIVWEPQLLKFPESN